MHILTLRSISPFRRAGSGGRLLAATFIALLPIASASAHMLQVGPLVILKSISVRAEGDLTVVEIEADGPLPPPATGRLDQPARFFLDFAGVITGTHGPRTGLGAVTRVRVALNSSNPPVTRVVLDLPRQHEIQIVADGREAGRIRVLVGAPLDASNASPGPAPESTRAETEAPPLPVPPPMPTPRSADDMFAPGLLPVPPLPPPPPPAEPSTEPGAPAPSAAVAASTPPERLEPAPRQAPSTTQEDPPPPRVYSIGSGSSPAPASARELAAYRNEVRPQLTKLRELRPLLSALDAQTGGLPDGLQSARTELGTIIRGLRTVRPSESLQAVHDMLLRAASLSLMAVTLRADTGTRADPTVVRNAASAAAGALLLLDQVCIEIGCEAEPGGP